MENIEGFSMENISPKLKTGRVCLLDADYVKYIVTSKIYKEREKQEITGEVELYLKEDPAIKHTKDWINEWFSKIDDPIIFCFSGKSYNTFRNHVAIEKGYKANRTKDYTEYDGKLEDMVKTVKYIQDNYVSLIFNDLEADDIVSSLQVPDKTYIISKDKDLKQVPGFHYDFERNSIYEITNEEAVYNLAFQLIAGDTTDNIGGIPKMGEVKAHEFLSKLTPKQYIKETLGLYQKKFGIFKGTDMFAETWYLVKMRENRGAFFKEKYKLMFDTQEMMLLECEKQKLKG